MIDGPSGSGKTYTALEIATGISEIVGRPFGVLDSQNGQSLRYAGLFDFYADIIRQYDPDTYIRKIREAEDAKLAALIMDSATHEWMWCLSAVDGIASRGSANNAWREVTPKHKRFVEAIIQATIPIIVTVRTNTDWVYAEEKRGQRTVITPHKVGTKPEQRAQFEFEFDLWLRMDRSNKALVEKSVFPFLENGTDIGRPDREIGKQIIGWFEGTSFDPEAELQERERHTRASDRRGSQRQASQPAAMSPQDAAAEAQRRRAAGPASDGPMAGQRGTGEIIDPDLLPAGVTDPEAELPGDDDPEDDEDPEDESEDDETDDDELDEAGEDQRRRELLIARYRTMAAVAVMRRRPDAAQWAGADLDDMTEAELQGYIGTLEQDYPGIKQTGAYQCDVCGKKIFPHVIEEFRGTSFPGLQLIAISVRDFKRALCAEDLARERTKSGRRGERSAPAKR